MKKLIVILGILTLILITLIIMNQEKKEIEMPKSDKGWTDSGLFTNSEYQRQQKQDIKTEYNAFSAKYTLENPYIKVNPYQINPLSAYVIFDSTEPVKYSYQVQGKDEKTNFNYIDDSYDKRVIIPIIGLYENTDNQVKIIVENEAGEKSENTIKITTSKAKYNPVKVKVKDEIDSDIETGWYFDPQYNGFDINGDIRFNMNAGVEDNYMKFIDNKLYIKTDNYQTIYEMDIMGNITGTYKTPSAEYNFHHDLTKAKDGTIYALGSYNVDLPNVPAAETLVFKYNDSGKPDEVIDLEKEFENNPVSSYGTPNQNDRIHLNSIDMLDEENQFIVSSQSQSFIAGIDINTEEVAWIIQNDEGNVENKDKALKIKNPDEFEYTSGQHTAFVTNNSKYDKYRGDGKYVISVFNNNNCKNADGKLMLKKYEDPINQEVCIKQNADILIYAIDLNKKTVEQVDSFSDVNEVAPIMSSVFDIENDKYITHYNRIGEPRSYIINSSGEVLVEYCVDYNGFQGYYRSNFRTKNQITKMLDEVNLKE